MGLHALRQKLAFLPCRRHKLDRFPSHGPRARNTVRISRDSKTTHLYAIQEYVGCIQMVKAVVMGSR